MTDQLNRLVAEKVIAQLNEQGVEIDEGFLDRLMAKEGKVAGFEFRIKAQQDKGEPVPGGEPQAAEAEKRCLKVVFQKHQNKLKRLLQML